MVYVERDVNNKVVGLYDMKQSMAQEELPDNHPDVVAFHNPVIDTNALDINMLNATLAADGSIVRALALVMFDEMKKTQPTLTLAQFRALVKSKMR